MWIFPFLLIGAFFLAGRARGAAATPVVRVVGPINVLDQYVRSGAVPPPQVIMCALAEAELCGQQALATSIVAVYMAPVVAKYGKRSADAGMPSMAPDSPHIRAPSPAPSMAAATDEEIQAALNADPESFMRGDFARAMEAARPPMEEPLPVTEDEMNVEGSSPIPNVAPVDWSKFCDKLSREPATYQSPRHVGQYRQNKARLAELGIDPSTVVGSVTAQRAALDTDLADAYQHVHASGLVQENLHRVIRLPGSPEPHTVTLSGVLGVVQAAGLEGASDWLDKPKDRERFPHTTAAFARTNGVF